MGGGDGTENCWLEAHKPDAMEQDRPNSTKLKSRTDFRHLLSYLLPHHTCTHVSYTDTHETIINGKHRAKVTVAGQTDVFVGEFFSQAWWLTPLIPARRRQRQMDLYGV